MHPFESPAVNQSAHWSSPFGLSGPYRYSAFGLSISSELPLPEFVPAGEERVPADVIVSFGPGEWIERVREERSFWSVEPLDTRYWCRGVGGFHVRGGREIILTPEPEADEGLLRLYVEGMMIASILRQRGLFVLHSSVVQIDDYAVAFLGHVGAGKSSAAAALHMRGHAVVTDDNAAIDLTSPQPKVIPAFPSIKMFPQIAVSLGYGEDSLEVMHASQIKRARSVDRNFPRCPVPLRRIYVLTKEPVEGFVRLSRAEYMLEIIRNSVPTRWGQAGDANHLKQCAQLAGLISAWRFRTFDHPEQLPELARRIENHSGEEPVACA